MNITIIMNLIKTMIYNNKVEMFRDMASVRVKILKEYSTLKNEIETEENNIKIVLYRLNATIKSVQWRTTEWLGLPWESIDSISVDPVDLPISYKFYYVPINFNPVKNEYYSIGYTYNGEEYFTNPLYYNQFGFLYPIPLIEKAMGTFNVDGTHMRIYEDNFDDFKFRDWCDSFSYYVLGLSIISMFISIYIIRCIFYSKEEDEK